jgi:hypothetical protein
VANLISFTALRTLSVTCCISAAFTFLGCDEKNSDAPISPFVAACLKPLGKTANLNDEKNCRCIYSSIDVIPNQKFADTLRQVTISQNGNVKAIVLEMGKLIHTKMSGSNSHQVYSLQSVAEGLSIFQQAIESCVKH